MKNVMLVTTSMFFASAALASVADLDTDGDGFVSYPEMISAYPSMTEDGFNIVDTNGDGVVDPDEMDAAVAGGLLPAKDG